jgi:hypothetical protein
LSTTCGTSRFEHIPEEVERSVLDELNAALVLEVDPDYYVRSRWRSNDLMARV